MFTTTTANNSAKATEALTDARSASISHAVKQFQNTFWIKPILTGFWKIICNHVFLNIFSKDREQEIEVIR